MAQLNKQQLQDKCTANNIAFEADATNAQLEELLAPVFETERVAKAAADKEAADKKAVADAAENAKQNAPADFGWAFNVVKLNRAKAWVNATTPGLSGKELEKAVKARYVLIGGLLADQKPVRAPKGNVVNLGADDGSDD